jgi:tetratricopeptide (TPR) repeat protein
MNKHLSNDNDRNEFVSMEQILAYKNGTLEAGEKARLEQQARHDPFLADALDGLATIPDAESFSRNIDALNARVLQQVQAEKKSSNITYKVAALAAAVLAFVIVFQITFNNPPTNAEVYAEYFKPYPNVVPLVRDSQSLSPLQEAMYAYESGDLSTAGIKLKKLAEQAPASNLTRFYMGIIDLQQGNTAAAESTFRTIVATADAQFSEPAQWYLALSYLQSGQKDKAENLFNEIARAAGSYRQPASDILRSGLFD